eukprot:scaffold49413_cov21-Tisochrysis_lutea.AAC.3
MSCAGLAFFAVPWTQVKKAHQAKRHSPVHSHTLSMNMYHPASKATRVWLQPARLSHAIRAAKGSANSPNSPLFHEKCELLPGQDEEH